VVFAPGGGWITNPSLLELVPPGSALVWLRVQPQTALERLRATGVTRPLLQVNDALARMEQLLHERSPLYERADVSFDTDECDPQEVADAISEWLINQKKSAWS
jgi:shikimate kinase